MRSVRATELFFAAALASCATVEGTTTRATEPIVVPTEEEADAAAEAAIDSENADDELLRLTEEIEGDR